MRGTAGWRPVPAGRLAMAALAFTTLMATVIVGWQLRETDRGRTTQAPSEIMKATSPELPMGEAFDHPREVPNAERTIFETPPRIAATFQAPSPIQERAPFDDTAAQTIDQELAELKADLDRWPVDPPANLGNPAVDPFGSADDWQTDLEELQAAINQAERANTAQSRR